MGTSRGDPTQRNGRGQTNLDLLVGMTVFLLAVGFVFSTISGMVDPFVGGQEHPLLADRLTTLLAEGMLADVGHPSVLNSTCAFGFFNASYLAHNGTSCAVGFRANESDLADRLNVSDRYSINVTVRRDIDADGDLEVRCTDGSSVLDCPAETRMAAGPAPPPGRQIIAARRTVFLNERDVIIEVKVW